MTELYVFSSVTDADLEITLIPYFKLINAGATDHLNEFVLRMEWRTFLKKFDSTAEIKFVNIDNLINLTSMSTIFFSLFQTFI